MHVYTSYVLFSLYNNYCIFWILCIIPHTHTQVLHGANPVLWDPKRTVRWNQDRQREQGGVEWGGYGMLDHTVHPLLHTGLLQHLCTPVATPTAHLLQHLLHTCCNTYAHLLQHLLHTCCNTYADQQRIRELTKQLREMAGREKLTV